MNIRKFVREYYFHDSSLEEVVYDESRMRLEMHVDFCFWMQLGYKKEMPKTGMVRLVFNGVHSFNGKTGYLDFATILKFDVSDDDTIQISLLDECADEYFEIIFVASEVDMQIL